MINKNYGIKSLRFPILNEITTRKSSAVKKIKFPKLLAAINNASLRVDLEPRKILSFPKLQTTPLDPLSDDREATMDRTRWER